MTEEQKEIMRRAYEAVNILKIDRDMRFEKDPNDTCGQIIDFAINAIETMVKEWAFAIGHPVEVSKETIMEIVDRVTPIVGKVVKERIAEGKL